jgi:hypothetical protein
VSIHGAVPAPDGTRVLVLGLGDLGRRLALGLAVAPEVGTLILAARDRPEARSFAALASCCGPSIVRFVAVDVSRPGEVAALLRRETPDAVVNAASALSPWHVSGRADRPAQALRDAGFGVQLPAQLSVLAAVMRGVREAAVSMPVVNASYPDLTHPVLAAHGLAPTIGFGNAAMIQSRVEARLRDRGAAAPLVRVLAHHAHVTPVMRGAEMPGGSRRPRIFLGEEGTPADELAWWGDALPADSTLNALSAATGVALIRALTNADEALRISAPGPFGLPGGFPVKVTRRRIELDLPRSIRLEEAIAFQWESARMDGVSGVDADGTVHFTTAAREALARADPGLAEPLTLLDVDARLARLRRFLGLG